MNPLQRQHQQLIIGKISEILEATHGNQAERLTQSLDEANHIFIAGAGRSKLVGSFLAMRLMHSGYEVSLVGEVTTPAIRKGDLLLTISNSGETEQLIAFTRRAKELRATVTLITAREHSTIGKIADQILTIGTTESFTTVKGMPMGTLFELSALCFLESFISQLIWGKEIAEEEMKNRHTNLE